LASCSRSELGAALKFSRSTQKTGCFDNDELNPAGGEIDKHFAHHAKLCALATEQI
jgi:hypothetical protein